MRRGLYAALVAAMVATAGLVVAGSRPAQSGELRCNGNAALCDRALGDVAFATTHNSMAATVYRFVPPNQRRSIPSQLRHGIRGFQIDVYGGTARVRVVVLSLGRRLVRTVVATMAGAEEFGYIVAAEVHRRGLDLAARKGYVCDGELANWTIFEEHFRAQGFVPILDFLHLLAHLYAAAQAAGGGPARQWARYLDWLRWAWGGQREKLWAALCAAASRAGAPPKGVGDQDPRLILAQTVQYVEHNLERMDYPRYRKLGLPISSAPVESAIKQFNRRMKGTEKFWTPAGAEAVLQVRAAYLSEDGRAERYWNTPRPHYRAVGRNRLALVA